MPLPPPPETLRSERSGRKVKGRATAANSATSCVPDYMFLFVSFFHLCARDPRDGRRGPWQSPAQQVRAKRRTTVERCHGSASVDQQMLLSQQLAPQQQLRLDLLPGSSGTSSPQTHRTFSSALLRILSPQRSRTGSRCTSPHTSWVPAS